MLEDDQYPTIFCGPSTPNHVLLDSAPNIGPLISRWELDKFKTFRKKIFRTSKILTHLYQQFSNLLISTTRYEWYKIRGTGQQ